MTIAKTAAQTRNGDDAATPSPRRPDVADILAMSVQAYGQGNLDEALRLGRAAIAARPREAPAYNLVGLIQLARGDAADAVTQLRRASDLDGQTAEYANNLGFVLHDLGDLAAARVALERALAIDPRMANAANNLGSVLDKLGEPAQALAWYRKALDIDPAFVEASDNLLAACARIAPQWHFPMIADGPRNQAYADALARAAPGKRVLDIGSGSGLLAMMAAKAGAAHVVTCEMQPVIAGLAKSIVVANGLEDRIDVWPMKSDQLQGTVEPSERAQVLVTETFSSGLLSEQVLATVEDAHARLLAPDAIVIPRRAAAIGRLVGGDILENHLFAATWSDLDLSAFDLLAPQRVGLHLDRVPYLSLSGDFEIFGFDLSDHAFPPEHRTLTVKATAAGRCIGVAQWIRLDLDEATVYENRPTQAAGANGWMHVVYRLSRPIDLQPGDEIRLVARHNRSSIAIGLDG